MTGPLSLIFMVAGNVIACLISDGQSSKYAVKMCRAFLAPEIDTLHLVTAIMNEDQR